MAKIDPILRKIMERDAPDFFIMAGSRNLLEFMRRKITFAEQTFKNAANRDSLMPLLMAGKERQ